jgi:hypothetical protein
MSLRVMTLVGLLVLVLGCMMFWPAPATIPQPRSAKPIGRSAVSQGGGSFAAQSRSPMDRPDPGGSREDLDMQRR